MPKTQLSHSKPRRRRAAGRRIRTWRYLLITVLFAALVVVGVGMASGEQAKAVKSVEAASGPTQVEVEIATEGAEAPVFSVFPLREPDRLVVDIPGLRWAPGLTTELPAASPQVQRIRVGQFSVEPPITRIVFDLAVAAQGVSYESLVATGEGRLRLRVREAPAGAGVTKAAGAPLKPSPSRTTAEAHPIAAAPTVTPAAPVVEEETTPVPPPAEAIVSEIERQPKQSAAATAPPVRETPTAVGAMNHPIRYALTAVVVVLAWAGAVWVRRRFRFGQRETAPTIAASAPAVPQEAFDFEQTDVVRCKVVDGYLLVAPEGGKEALASLGPSARVQARGDVTLALTMADDIAAEDEEAEKVPAMADVAGDTIAWATEAEELVMGLGDEDAFVRKAAARGLRDLAVRGHGEVLFSYLRRTDPHIRSVIAAALGEAKVTSAGAMLASMTQDTDPSVRASVMYALGQLGEAAAPYREEVLARVDDSEGMVRARAIEALAAIAPNSAEAAALVTELTGDADLLVREAAATAVFSFAKHDLGQPLLELLADFTRRAQALEVLQQAEEPVLRRLLVAARNADPATAQAAMDTLSYVVSRRWTAADFREELSSTDPDIRMAGLEGLSIVGGAEAMREARRVMGSDPSPDVRARATEIVSAWDSWMAEGAGATAGREREQV